MATESSDVAPQATTTPRYSAEESYPAENVTDSEGEKTHYAKVDVESTKDSHDGGDVVLQDERDIATHVITIDDDPTANPWTFRSFFIGIGLSAFGGVLAEIYYFKPQTVYVSTLFLAIIAYVIGIFMEAIIPRNGWLRYLNPHPFNKKENAFIVIMASAAANSALATEVLAVQRLYYDITPNPGASIFLLFSSQLLGYGLGGLMRTVLLYPSKMLYPGVLPLVSMFDALFKDGANATKKLRLFYIAFACIFVWEIIPEWIFPLLTGISVFCLANQKSANFTYIFGGSNGNEGLGLLSIGLDWQYISGGTNPFTIPLQAQFSGLIGYLLCIVCFCIVWYKNIWKAQNFPFLSQLLYYENGTEYNQLLILNSNYEVDPTLLAEQGLPYYSSTWVVYLIASNMSVGATFVHMFLWNYSDLKGAWSWATPTALKHSWNTFSWKFWQNDGMRDQDVGNPELDPHYVQMLKYPDAPNSWYFLTLLISVIIALVVIYKTNSTLPWWGFLVACLLAVISLLLTGALYAITGLIVNIQPLIQMVGGFLHPGKPMANMYFVLFGYNSVSQGQLLLRDLKIAQYTKLPPRAAFTAQIIGTLFGAVLNFVLMNTIIDIQTPILLSPEGSNIWSGQQPQQYNSQAVAWGGFAHEIFASGKRYQWVSWSYLAGLAAPVPFWLVHRYCPKLRADYYYTPIIIGAIGVLSVGINSSITSYFAVSWFSQWFLRTHYPRWFAKYNYILAAALDGGTQVMVFILSFAVAGAAGTAHLFPEWAGAYQEGNYDRCYYIDT
ncbi:OPT superfamily oligopeptide transporter [Athelia psychrophila]|uniref:OPT superfamily oligopeptide transporter n=1 Tax=Athelia psychrophila TaxID=1759441 RepID=A0A166ANU0_9AGAM|nr:OPT superfamily oligopeptide transporter [Fibularhizoctonia sp. CBS 109695]